MPFGRTLHCGGYSVACFASTWETGRRLSLTLNITAKRGVRVLLKTLCILIDVITLLYELTVYQSSPVVRPCLSFRQRFHFMTQHHVIYSKTTHSSINIRLSI
jgi:hypothetical protein